MESRKALEKIFKVSRFIGAFPFTPSFQVSLGWWLAIAIFELAMSIYSILYIPEIYTNVISVRLIRTIKSFILTCSVVAAPIYMMRNRKYFEELSSHLEQIEEQMVYLTPKWSCSPKVLSMLLFPAACTLISTSQFFFYYRSMDFLTAFSLNGLAFGLVTTMFYIGQYTSLLGVLRSLMVRFCDIADTEAIVMNYQHLMIGYRAIERVYGFQVLLYFVISLSVIMHSLHYTFSNPEGWLWIFQFLWISLFSSHLICIINKCSDSVKETKKINEYLYKRMMDDRTNTYINNELLLFHLTSCRKLIFTACGFFTLDKSLICSMVAFATTYLVILLQFTYPTYTNN